ncbi:ABC transporter substrate-binding protein [Nocardioides sp. CFH 31398]|uniref:ABC transporter substrate-binding protein n=1 Tax=Nocardioides sp. CFH 31398 TaxID=2919579 RepID=UPI001F05A537|nr:ABC transporter substrate-binding protein [Nocardioides sp. CFH 31398]MCH1867883.1 ABC transporter substrate-binding protein [Nocardioides sp. CFH 31398]
MTTSRRRFLTGLSSLAVAVPVLAACGVDGSTSDGSSGASGEESGAAEEFTPVEIEHKYGTTTIEQQPTKVAVVGLMEQDALLALGIAPVATTFWFGEAEGRIFPWAQEAFDATGADLPTVLENPDGIPVEEVAGLAPDLIIGLYSGMTKQEYEQLSGIAPVVAQSAEFGDYGMPWDEMTRTIARAVGKEDEGEQLVASVTEQIETAAADNADVFEGKSIAVVTPYEGLFVYGPEDPRARMLDQLGMTFPDVLLEGRPEGEFGWSVSAERTTDLDQLDGVVWLDLGAADAGMTRLWESTTPAEENAFVDISDADGAYYVGHSMVTPLSIPYVLERYVPQLQAVLDGDPGTEPPAPQA